MRTNETGTCMSSSLVWGATAAGPARYRRVMELHSPRAKHLTILAATILACVACGGDDPPSDGVDGADAASGTPALALPDPCSLLSPAEVESLLGEPVVGEARDSTTAGGDLRRCDWQRKYSPEIRSDEIVITVAAAAAYSTTGPTALVGASPYAIGDEGQLLDQSRGVQIHWKKAAFSATYRYGLTGAFTGDFEPLRARAKELAQAANTKL